MAKKSAIIEEPTQEEVVAVEQTPVVEEKPWEGHPSRDFISVAPTEEPVVDAPVVEETAVEETPVVDGGQEQA